jgi:hypothetical protein
MDRMAGRTKTLCKNANDITKHMTLKNDLKTKDCENIRVLIPIRDDTAQLNTGRQCNGSVVLW